MVRWQIVNIVATAELDQRIDLRNLGRNDNVKYNPEVYGGRVAYLTTSNILGKISIFASGKLISVGTKSEEDAKSDLDCTNQFLFENSIIKEKSIIKPKIRNIVTNVNFEVNLNLESFSEIFNPIYEPEQFPGAIMRIKEPFTATFLLFASGKAVILGLKNKKDIEPTIIKIENMIHSIQ